MTIPSTPAPANLALIKLLIVGDPGTAKTGAGAALANAGFRVNVANCDGNVAPLFDYTRPEARANLSVQVLGERVKLGAQGFAYDGAPNAQLRLIKLLQDWPDGRGPATSWGAETVFMLDPFSHLSELMVDRWHALNPGEEEVKAFIPVFEELALLLRFLKHTLRCHVIVTSHLKTPGEPMDRRSRDEKRANPRPSVPEGATLRDYLWRRYPSVAGRKMGPELGSFFDLILHAKSEGAGRSAARVLSLVPAIDVDVKAPAHLFAPRAALPVATGLAEFFAKILASRGLTPAPESAKSIASTPTSGESKP